MNRFINALQVFLLIPVLLFTIYVAFDLPVSFIKKIPIEVATDNDMFSQDISIAGQTEFPYQAEIFIGLGLLVLIINLRRSIRRWMGMRIVTRTSKFKWNTPVSTSRKKRVVTYNILEALVYGVVGFALFTLTEKAWMPAIAYFFVAVDNILFSLVAKGKDTYRIGLSSKALVVADRDVIVLYFKGLRKVSVLQQSVYFDYVKDLQLSFPSDCIQEENKEEFFELLEAQLDPDRVYFTRKAQ